MPTQKIEISIRTIVYTISLLLLLKFLWIIRDLISSLLIAFIIMSSLKPFVSFFVKKKVPRLLATGIVYIVFLFVIFNIFFLIMPPLIKESIHLLRSLPFIIQNLSPTQPTFFNPESATQYLPTIANSLFNLIRNIFTNALFIISTLFFGFYFLLEENMIKKFLSHFFLVRQTKLTTLIFNQAEKRMNAWFWGEIILMTVVGLMTFVGLNIIGMKYTLALSVLAGLLEVIPNVGPVVSLVPAFIIGVGHSPVLGIATVVLYLVVQQLENHMIVPLVMNKAVGLNPIITLMSLVIGGKLAGVIGVLLAVPTALFLETILMEVLKTKKING